MVRLLWDNCRLCCKLQELANLLNFDQIILALAQCSSGALEVVTSNDHLIGHWSQHVTLNCTVSHIPQALPSPPHSCKNLDHSYLTQNGL